MLFRSPLRELPAVQAAILNNTSQYVKAGGVLLYSTCTVLERENEKIVKDFLAGHSDFKVEAFTLPGPAGVADNGMITLWPQHHDTDGFFICKMRKGERAL